MQVAQQEWQNGAAPLRGHACQPAAAAGPNNNGKNLSTSCASRHTAAANARYTQSSTRRHTSRCVHHKPDILGTCCSNTLGQKLPYLTKPEPPARSDTIVLHPCMASHAGRQQNQLRCQKNSCSSTHAAPHRSSQCKQQAQQQPAARTINIAHAPQRSRQCRARLGGAHRHAFTAHRQAAAVLYTSMVLPLAVSWPLKAALGVPLLLPAGRVLGATPFTPATAADARPVPDGSTAAAVLSAAEGHLRTRPRVQQHQHHHQQSGGNTRLLLMMLMLLHPRPGAWPV
ncbi:hypothetical protein COO60DRAFT_1459246 [Scenedesmus sp. NREL 46B-D3]|nr:hypothetical protein COO60DRAFT_1459246 [Scenedesmus sp. NREL 46B-D3]